MDKRFEPLAQACDHNSMFALTYLRTTEEYRRSATAPGFFSDPAFINHQDAVFARYYFDAWDGYRDGTLAEVSQSWQIAFDAADRQKVAGSGNLLLGMSAHVNRDLPLVLAEIGLVKPDGSSRKPDHDKVNQFLNRVIEPLFDEAAARLDPTVDDSQVDGTTMDETAIAPAPRGLARAGLAQRRGARERSHRGRPAHGAARDRADRRPSRRTSSWWRPPTARSTRRRRSPACARSVRRPPPPLQAQLDRTVNAAARLPRRAVDVSGEPSATSYCASHGYRSARLGLGGLAAASRSSRWQLR